MPHPAPRNPDRLLRAAFVVAEATEPRRNPPIAAAVQAQGLSPCRVLRLASQPRPRFPQPEQPGAVEADVATPMSLEVISGADSITVLVIGDVDRASTDLLEEAMAQLGGEPRRLVIDLQGVTFLDSMGLGHAPTRPSHLPGQRWLARRRLAVRPGAPAAQDHRARRSAHHHRLTNTATNRGHMDCDGPCTALWPRNGARRPPRGLPADMRHSACGGRPTPTLVGAARCQRRRRSEVARAG